MIRVIYEKEMQDTGGAGKPYYVVKTEIKRLYFIGLLIKAVETCIKYPNKP